MLVAQDFDRRLEARRLDMAAVRRQGAAHLEEGAGQEHQDRKDGAGHELREASGEPGKPPH